KYKQLSDSETNQVKDNLGTHKQYGKEISEKYVIDINYTSKLLTARSSINTPVDALKSINESIISLSEKFI
ncbi:MAG: hypothetical protein PUA77_07985, partial [Lachnospiraceae bacterium]|nr:hypothetical protein [Lachnospiraceae bacterium]